MEQPKILGETILFRVRAILLAKCQHKQYWNIIGILQFKDAIGNALGIVT